MTRDKLYYRRLNKTYYQDLERIHKLLIANGQRVLEIGCGTGDLLASLNPSYGVGIELDSTTSKIASERHNNLHIFNLNVEEIFPENIGNPEPFDIIVINNTLNTIKDVHELLKKLTAYSHNKTRLVISFHNWLWQPLLKIKEIRGQTKKCQMRLFLIYMMNFIMSPPFIQINSRNL